MPPCDVCKLVKGIEAVPVIGKTLRTLRLAGEVPWR